MKNNKNTLKTHFKHIVNNISVSIIIPLHNRKELLKRALYSVLKQTILPLEILICDDGSTDNPQSIMSDFAESAVEIIWLENKECHGVSHARNQGIAAAKGDFIAFLDSDDEWLPKKLELQLAFFRENPEYNIIHADEIWIRNGVRVNPCKRFIKTGGNIFNRSLDFSLIAPSAVMAKREIFDKCGIFDENLPVCEDYDLWLRIMLTGEEFGFISTPLVTRYAGHAGQLSTRYEAMDRFRAESLYKLLQMTNIPTDKREKMQETLHQKAQILLKGAEKRNNNDNIKLFQSYLDF